MQVGAGREMLAAVVEPEHGDGHRVVDGGLGLAFAAACHRDALLPRRSRPRVQTAPKECSRSAEVVMRSSVHPGKSWVTVRSRVRW